MVDLDDYISIAEDSPERCNGCAFSDGNLLVDHTISGVRKRLRIKW